MATLRIVDTDIFWDLDSGCYCKRERIYLLIYSILFNNITVVGGIDNTVSITPIPMWVSGGRATALITTAGCIISSIPDIIIIPLKL